MNFNKDYPIAILDTNIVMDVPNILDILKGCNIVIPFTLIEELDNHKKENKGARDFVNNFLALSEKANLSKDGYKLENDCMLYLDIDKNNSYHKDINLDSKKQDIKFIAEAKNLKEKYNDMEVVLISSDKIMKITASNFEVEVKTLEEFISKYIKDNDKNAILDILYNLFEEYSKNRDNANSELIYKMIYDILVNSNNIDGLFKLAEKSRYNYIPNSSKEIYEKIYSILVENKDIDGLYKLSESYNPDKKIYEKISNILAENKDIDGLYKLFYSYPHALLYEKISNILAENKDIDGLYKLSESYNPYEVYPKISNILAENKDIDGLYKLVFANYYNACYEIFNILAENKDIDGLYKLVFANYYNACYEIFNILAENKDIDGLYKLSIIYNPNEKVDKKIFNILVENKDIDGLYKLKRRLPSHAYLSKEIDYKIRELENNK